MLEGIKITEGQDSFPLSFPCLQVSLGSSISAPQQVAFAETDFPDTVRGLLKWARRKHGGVTSLAEYRGVNTIYTRLGPGMGHREAELSSELHAVSMGVWDVLWRALMQAVEVVGLIE